MSAAEEWYATRNFKGVGTDGKPRDYTRGDSVPDVQSWPTFNSLRSINWIVASPVTSTQKRTTSQPNEVVSVVAIEKPASKKTKVKSASSTDKPFACEICTKPFATSRALNVHKRYH